MLISLHIESNLPLLRAMGKQQQAMPQASWASHGGLSQLTSRPNAAVASHQWLAALNQRFQADPPSGGLHTPSGGLHSAGVLVPPLVGNVLTQNWASWRSGGLSQRHHASGCPGLLPASARQPLGPHPATSGLYSA